MGVNREKARQPKLGKFWCCSCDRALMSKGQKCPVCNNREQKREKKGRVRDDPNRVYNMQEGIE